MVAKLFLVLVELARILVAFFLWASPRRRTQHWLIKGNLIEKWLGHLFEVWFSELICCSTVQNSVTADGSLLSPTGGVKSISPIQENSIKNGYDESKGYDESYENKCATNYSIITNNNWNDAYNNKQLTMHNKYTNDDVDTMHLHFNGRVLYMHWACTRIFPQPWWLSHTHLMAQVLSAFTLHPWSSTWRTLLDSPFHFLLLPFPPVCPRLPLPPRAVPRAPLHEEHGKPALLRWQKRVRTPWTSSTTPKKMRFRQWWISGSGLGHPSVTTFYEKGKAWGGIDCDHCHCQDWCLATAGGPTSLETESLIRASGGLENLWLRWVCEKVASAMPRCYAGSCVWRQGTRQGIAKAWRWFFVEQRRRRKRR